MPGEALAVATRGSGASWSSSRMCTSGKAAAIFDVVAKLGSLAAKSPLLARR